MSRQSSDVIDLRSNLMVSRTPAIAQAMADAVLRAPTMKPGEDADERALYEWLGAELGVEAVLLVPTCTMANQIAIRLHLPTSGVLATTPLSHVLRLETAATELTGVAINELWTENDLKADFKDFIPGNGHPAPQAVEQFCRTSDPAVPRLVWIENTHLLTVGSVLSTAFQAQIVAACKASGVALHLDGSRL